MHSVMYQILFESVITFLESFTFVKQGMTKGLEVKIDNSAYPSFR